MISASQAWDLPLAKAGAADSYINAEPSLAENAMLVNFEIAVEKTVREYFDGSPIVIMLGGDTSPNLLSLMKRSCKNYGWYSHVDEMEDGTYQMMLVPTFETNTYVEPKLLLTMPEPIQAVSAYTDLAVGMITAPRAEITLFRSVSSFRKAGFKEKIHLFAEPGSVDSSGLEGVERHNNQTRLGSVNNWKHALERLVGTGASWLLLLEDDTVWCKDAAARFYAALHNPPCREVGFLSLFASRAMVLKQGPYAWQSCNAGKHFYGSLAMAFPRASAELILKNCDLVKANCSPDSNSGAVMAKFELPCYVHVPSLAEHIGETSTIGHGLEPVSCGLCGELA